MMSTAVALAKEFNRLVSEYRSDTDGPHGTAMQEEIEMFVMDNLDDIAAALSHVQAPAKALVTKEWFERKEALEDGQEIGAGRRLFSTVEELEQVAFNALPEWARKEILAYRTMNTAEPVSVTVKTVAALEAAEFAMEWAQPHLECDPITEERGINEAHSNALEMVKSALTALAALSHVQAPALRVAFEEGKKEPRIISWNDMPVGEHSLYTQPAPHVDDAAVERAAARAKAVSFISEHDPFGDVFSQHELRQIEGDAALGHRTADVVDIQLSGKSSTELLKRHAAKLKDHERCGERDLQRGDEQT